MITEPLEFFRDGRRYRAQIVHTPHTPADAPAIAMWFVSIDDGPERPVYPASEDDVPGEELERLLAKAAGGGVKQRFRLLSNDEIDHRMRELEAEGWPIPESTDFAEGLVRYTPGASAERAVQTIVDVVSDAEIRRLVSVHVMESARKDYPGLPLHAQSVAHRLVQLGFSPVRESGDGWYVGLDDGELFSGPDVYRPALLAVWLRAMRKDGGLETPPY
jgi:hypothetical protein